MAVTGKLAERIAAIKEYATANYEDGWSVVIETMTDDEIADKVKTARSLNGAIAMLRKNVVDIWKQQLANASSGDVADDEFSEEAAEQAEAEDGDAHRGLDEDQAQAAAEDGPAEAPAAVVGMKGHKPMCGCVGCKSARAKAGFPDDPAVAKVKAAKPAQPKVAKTPNACRCGCGNSTGSTFAPGHDARFASLLKKAYLAGEITKDDAQGQASAVSLNFSSKVRRMLDLADQAIAKAIQAEAGAVAK
jgi:hypothetical protein